LVPGEKSFDDTQEASEAFDCVVSEDSILHAGDGRSKVVKEAARVLRKGGIDPNPKPSALNPARVLGKGGI
jgi:hypothetical protein